MAPDVMLAVTGLQLDRSRALELEAELKRMPGVSYAYIDELAGLAEVECARGQCRLVAVRAILRGARGSPAGGRTRAPGPAVVTRKGEETRS